MDLEGSICNSLGLERMLNDKTAKPSYLRISLLEYITNRFSDDREIGSGGFAIVYKGVLQNGVVAVKKLTQMLDVHEDRFREEVDCLMRVKHKNVVRFLGYCCDTQGKFCELVNGKTVIAEERQRFLCFEYLPGTLDKYMKEQSRGHEWTTCYQIIKGICQGLHYLHQQKIVHLDLKPANILLDHDMVPKIADFGLSKRFDEDQTHAMTSNLIGSHGYMAPEFFDRIRGFKSDVYSLGIIITEILSGNKGYPDIDNDVLKIWRINFGTSPGDAQLEPVRVCTEIAKKCRDSNPAERPDTWRILEMLDEMERTYGVSKMADKAPSSSQRPGMASSEPNVMASNAAAAADVTNWQQSSRPSSFKDPAATEFIFSFTQLAAATKGFALEVKIGAGSFGTVYHGKLPDGREVAIIRGDSGPSTRRFGEVASVFWLEVAAVCHVQHKHLVALLGYCNENEECLLVYEYMKNGTLYDLLHPKAMASLSPVMSLWKLRIKILLDASHGIEYLHSYALPHIIHHDIKSSNILLDAYWTARLWDFGMLLTAGADAEEASQTTVPEYYGMSHLTSTKSDVYRFGVVMLEVLSGMRVNEANGGKPISSIVNHAVPSELGMVLDPRMPEPVAHETKALKLVADTAVHCVRMESKDRPAITDIVANLEEAFVLL